MYCSDKEQALNQLLNKIEILEEQISDTIVSYYIQLPIKINGIVVQMSIFELIQSIIYDYNNVVLKDFYKELD